MIQLQVYESLVKFIYEQVYNFARDACVRHAVHALNESFSFWPILGDFVSRPSTGAYPWTPLHFYDPDFGLPRCKNQAPPLERVQNEINF